MRVLLTSNASYAPPRGGSTRGNKVWMEHLAVAGHACSVVCAAPPGVTEDHALTQDSGIQVSVHYELSRRRDVLAGHIHAFKPDWVLVSSEDLGHALLREACEAGPGRVVYLAHTPQFFPFGPESWNRDAQSAARVREAAGVVAIGEHMRGYIREHLGREPVVIHPPIYGAGPYANLANFDSGYVLIVNPCAVKGISIFNAVRARMSDVPFAALKGWGTNAQDLRSLEGAHVFEPVRSIETVLAQTRVLLMPSLWYEGFGLIAMEAMLRGIPVVSSNSGGLMEAKSGTGYVIPVAPIARYLTTFDEVFMPRPVIPEQDIDAWEAALRELLNDRAAYEAESVRSREAALAFVGKLRASDIEEFLCKLKPREAKAASGLSERLERLSPEQRALLLARLKRS